MENSAQRSYCSACGKTLVEGRGSRFSQEFCHLCGSIGTTEAFLDLTITDRTFVAGLLCIDGGPVQVELLGLIDASGVLTLELSNSTIDVTSPEHEFPIPVQLIPPLVGRFDGQSFSGEFRDGDQPARAGNDPGIRSFHFVTTLGTTTGVGDDDPGRPRPPRASFGLVSAKAAYLRELKAKPSSDAGSRSNGLELESCANQDVATSFAVSDRPTPAVTVTSPSTGKRASLSATEPQSPELQFVWICPQCGRHVPRQVEQCRCGCLQPENQRSQPPSEVRPQPTELPLIQSTPWRWIIGGFLGGVTGYLVAAVAKFETRWILATTLWAGVVGGSLADLLRVEEGRLVFDRAAFSDLWGAGAFRRSRTLFSVMTMVFGLLMLRVAVVDDTSPNRGETALIGLSLLAVAGWIARARFDSPSTGIVELMTGDRMTRHRTTIGTILLVLGIGFIVFNLPDVLRYVLGAGYVDLSGGQDFVLALGAMMLASGWSLRRDR